MWESAHILERIARVAKHLGDMEIAVQACTAALARDPERKETLRLLCRILHDRRDADGLRSLAEQFPRDSEPLSALLSIAAAQDDHDGGLAYARRGTLADPDAPVEAGLVPQLISDGLTPEEAGGLLKRSCPFDFEGRMMVAAAMIEAGWTTEAKALLEESLDRGCHLAQSLLYYGLACVADGRSAH